MSDYYEELLDIATRERFECQDRLLVEIADKVVDILAEADGVDGKALLKWCRMRRIQLAVESGRISPNWARELMRYL